MGTNCTLLGTDCHLNETRSDLVFDSCERIEVTDLTAACPIFDPNFCQSDPCFCDPSRLPLSYPCPERFKCKWKVKSDQSSQNLSTMDKIFIGIGVSAFFILLIGVIICVFWWKRVCFEVTTSSNHNLYAVFHSNSDDSNVHCITNNEINTETP